MTDIKLINLPYQEALATLYPSVRELPYPILLDSNHQDFPTTRYDILVADPLAVIQAKASDCCVDWQQPPLYSVTNKQSPFAAIDELMQYACQEEWALKADKNLPFTGGVIGYFGYDSRHFLEHLPNTVTQDIELPDLVAGLYGWAIISLHALQKTFLMITPWCSDDTEQRIMTLIQTASAAAPVTERFSLKSPFRSNMTYPEYQQKFDAVKQYIYAGDCYQVNLAQRFSAHYSGDSFEAYQTLRKVCPTPFSAYMEIAPQQAILSHSPERFLLCDTGQVESKPIKGTRPRGKTPEEDLALAQELLNAEKDRAENLMIVDLLRNDMGRSCLTGSIKVPKLFALESYANVHHLVSTITGNIANAHDHVTVFNNSFPGGSITGAPKIRAMEIIDELEPHSRSAYCGSIAYFSSNGQMDSSITIRTLVADHEKIHCWAGGGLVLDSKCEEEYQETFTKVGHLTHTLEQDFLDE